MPLEAVDIVDLVKTTLRELGRMQFSQIATTIQEHVAFNTLMRTEKLVFQSGYELQFNVMTKHSGAAKWVGLYATDDVNVSEVMTQGTAPWRHINTNRGIDLHEVTMNENPARIVDLVKVNRVDSMISMAETFETDFWKKPADSTDKVKPWGVPVWIVWNTTEGFNGGNPVGFSAGSGNVDATVHTRWKNWSGLYTNVTKSDLVKKMRKAATFTRFMSPMSVPDYSTGERYGYYTNYSVLSGLEEIAEAQNQNLGNDVASKDGAVLFRQNPVRWVPQLENVAGNPVYGINWGHMFFGCLTGWLMRETGPIMAPNQHLVVVNHTDTTGNLCCRDKRRQFVLATADPAP